MAKKKVTPKEKTAPKKKFVSKKKVAPKRKTKKTPPGGKKSSASEVGVDFDGAVNDVQDAWKESRAKPPQSFSYDPPDVPDGDYIVQLVGARVGAYRSGKKKGTGYVRFRYTIQFGEYAGETLSSSDDVSNDPAGASGRTKMDFLSDRLQRLGIDVSKLELRELPELCQFLMDTEKNPEAKPYYRVAVKNNFTEGESGDTLHFQAVYINDQIHPDDFEEMKSQAS